MRTLFISHGAPVDEDSPSVAAAPKAPKPSARSERSYTLQVKATRSKQEADGFAKRLRRSGFEPHIVLATVPGKGRYYRVRLGRFASMKEARSFQRKYKALTGELDAGFVTDI